MYYGKYRAKVVDINDPEKRGRIKVECPNILGAQISNWALPCLPPFVFYIPRIDSLVWLEFEEGRIDSPIWTGNFYTTETWSTGAGLYDNEKGIIRLPIASEIHTLKTLDVTAIEDTLIETQAILDVTAVKDMSIKTDAVLNVESVDATNVTVGTALTVEIADITTVNSGSNVDVSSGTDINLNGLNVNANVGVAFNVNGG